MIRTIRGVRVMQNAAAAGVGRALMLLLSMAPYRLQMFFAARAPFR